MAIGSEAPGQPGGAGGCAGVDDDEEEELTGGKFVWDIGDVTSIAYGVAG